MPQKYKTTGFISMVSPTVHTNRQENGAFPNAFQTGELDKRRLCVLVWTE